MRDYSDDVSTVCMLRPRAENRLAACLSTYCQLFEDFGVGADVGGDVDIAIAIDIPPTRASTVSLSQSLTDRYFLFFRSFLRICSVLFGSATDATQPNARQGSFWDGGFTVL